jgi:hypothetical protein
VRTCSKLAEEKLDSAVSIPLVTSNYDLRISTISLLCRLLQLIGVHSDVKVKASGFTCLELDAAWKWRNEYDPTRYEHSVSPASSFHSLFTWCPCRFRCWKLRAFELLFIWVASVVQDSYLLLPTDSSARTLVPGWRKMLYKGWNCVPFGIKVRHTNVLSECYQIKIHLNLDYLLFPNKTSIQINRQLREMYVRESNQMNINEEFKYGYPPIRVTAQSEAPSNTLGKNLARGMNMLAFLFSVCLATCW